MLALQELIPNFKGIIEQAGMQRGTLHMPSHFDNVSSTLHYAVCGGVGEM